MNTIKHYIQRPEVSTFAETGSSTHLKGQSDGDSIAAEGHRDTVLCPEVLVNGSDVRGWGRREGGREKRNAATYK